MNESIVEKLLSSFDELDRCIYVTKQVLSGKDGVPEDILVRVEQYGEIVAKQRGLAHQLQEFIDAQDWQEVGRRVKLINGLSGMIRDDAQAILANAYADSEKAIEKKKEYPL